ncbi:Osmotin thaumatin-like protein [Stereum hirsutum FP-91666 SS1]|uniref:Osmotin thaumatin-like protein n=1 Tax=Stereum hirsutum (strain FP-91666) TaxID=721885 RepID=UPI000440D052|nr:Osmotin thaumatin-like protein [Stereum hirsutum FP-91666 SS1]EIM91068.1 Osmotin thaumatin-like protein [Stereum hirsutum FP-91666 SS1]
MKSIAATLAVLIAAASTANAFVIHFQNNCGYTVWPAVGKAPNGAPDTSVAYGTSLAAGGSVSYTIGDTELGIRAWGRTGCAADGTGCATGGCNGGLVCTDAGITSGVILSEYGYANFGAAYGGERTSWDLSRVDSSININTKLTSSDGQTVTCTTSSCADDQAYSYATDYAADRNSALGQTFTHTFCP